jgi:uncharacterized membrane protein YgdD (TMEM256/DUF423 family)
MNTAQPPKPAAPLSKFAAATIACGAFMGLCGIILGTLAAHGAHVEAQPLLKTASAYAMAHGMAMIPTVLARERLAIDFVACKILTVAILCFGSGVILFSGGLVLMSIGLNLNIVPVGGVLLMGGWSGLCVGALIHLRCKQ